ncbi:hypothetical protein D3C86_1822430 [compost metagenome]
MAQAGAPQAGEAVKDLAAVVAGVVGPLATGDEAGIGLEFAVAGVGHPVRRQPGGVGAGGVLQALAVGQVHGVLLGVG